MNSIFILLLLLFASALPVIILYFWIRKGTGESTIQVTPPWFLCALAAGIVSLLIAALTHRFFPPTGSADRLGSLFFSIFIKVALVEEISRLITLFPLLKVGNLRRNQSFAAILGLAAGLGFAAAENALYGMADINITLLRAFTAAPLHGACGIRIGAAIFKLNRQPVKAVFLFISALVMHGAYNLIIVSLAVPAIMAVPIALAALFISLPMLKSDFGVEE